MQIYKLHSNIRLIGYHAMIREMGFLTSVYILFAAWRGVSFPEFMTIQSVFVMVMLVADPLISPLADRYGRKPVILAGSLLWMLGHVAIGFGTGWHTFVFGEILLGLGAACNRSAADALLYDTLLSVNRADLHTEALGQQWRKASFAAGITMVIGSLLYEVSPLIPAALTVLFNLALPVIALQLQEMPHAEEDVKPSYWQILRAAWRNLASPGTRWVVLVPAFIGGTTIVLFWSMQPVFTGQGVGTWLLGGLLALHFYLRGKSAVQCRKLVETYGVRKCYALCIACMLTGFLAMAYLPWLVAYPFFVLGAGFTYMMTETMGKDILQRSVRSSVRSASIGGYHMVGRTVAASTMLGFPLLHLSVGLPHALAAIGLFGSMLAALSATRLRAV